MTPQGINGHRSAFEFFNFNSQPNLINFKNNAIHWLRLFIFKSLGIPTKNVTDFEVIQLLMRMENVLSRLLVLKKGFSGRTPIDSKFNQINLIVSIILALGFLRGIICLLVNQYTVNIFFGDYYFGQRHRPWAWFLYIYIFGSFWALRSTVHWIESRRGFHFLRFFQNIKENGFKPHILDLTPTKCTLYRSQLFIIINLYFRIFVGMVIMFFGSITLFIITNPNSFTVKHLLVTQIIWSLGAGIACIIFISSFSGMIFLYTAYANYLFHRLNDFQTTKNVYLSHFLDNTRYEQKLYKSLAKSYITLQNFTHQTKFYISLSILSIIPQPFNEIYNSLIAGLDSSLLHIYGMLVTVFLIIAFIGANTLAGKISHEEIKIRSSVYSILNRSSYHASHQKFLLLLDSMNERPIALTVFKNMPLNNFASLKILICSSAIFFIISNLTKDWLDHYSKLF